MTDIEIRLAIGRLCGYHFGTEDSCREECWRDKTGMVSQLPDYPNDLNAMFEADAYIFTNVMNADQWEQYGKELHKIHSDAVLLKSGYHPQDPIDWYDFAKFVTGLTARQRAEALLKALGLWKEKGMAEPKALKRPSPAEYLPYQKE